MWEFDQVHKYAVNKMPYTKVLRDPAEKVALAVQYDVQHWLVPGLMELAQRKEPLGSRDFEFLGPELTLKVAAIRESVTAPRGISLIVGSRDARSLDFTQVITRVFESQVCLVDYLLLRTTTWCSSLPSYRLRRGLNDVNSAANGKVDVSEFKWNEALRGCSCRIFHVLDDATYVPVKRQGSV